MKRHATVLLTILSLVLGVASASASREDATTSPATLRMATVSQSGSGGELFLRLAGAYTFVTTQPAGDTLLIDLKGVRAASVAKALRGSASWLAGYRLLQYRDASGQSVVRVQIELKHAGPVEVRQERAGLRVLLGSAGVAATEAASPSPAKDAATSSTGPLEVSGVSVRAETAGEAVVDVATTRPATYRVLHLENPPRLVVDLDGAHNAAPRRSYAASSDVLKGVRVGQFHDRNPSVARVVADLTGDPIFDVHAYSGGVRIELKSRTLANTTAEATPPAPAPMKTEVTGTPAAVPAPAVPAVAMAEKPASPEPKTEVIAQKESAPAPAAPAKAEFQSTLPAVTPAAATVRPAPQEKTPESLRAAEAAHTLSGSEIVLAAGQGQGGAAGSAQETPKYTGEPISLNLKDVDLKDFFRLIHEISGLNIIVDPNVSGTVTLVLDSVPWDQALDIVLKNNGLGKQLEGNVLRIAKLETLTAEQEAASKLAAARDEAQPLVTIFRPINYAKASTIQTMLKSWVGGGALTKRGNVLVDDRTNTLIISDIQTQIPIIESIIAKLDRKAKQVVIEARIVLATATFSRNLNAALSGVTGNHSLSTGVAGATGTGSSASSTAVPGLPIAAPTANSVTSSAASASGFGAFTIVNGSSRYLLEAAISAAETKSQAKTISRPTIVTQNNQAGSVTQGVQIPIQTSINNTVMTSFTSAALTMTVTPQVTDDGNIFMQINVNNASPGAVLTTAGPSINTQQATTQVLVPDGGTVVFGGVTVTGRTRSATYVPLIGSIPVIGHLFKSSNVQDNDQELLFFVTPKILVT